VEQQIFFYLIANNLRQDEFAESRAAHGDNAALSRPQGDTMPQVRTLDLRGTVEFAAGSSLLALAARLSV